MPKAAPVVGEEVLDGSANARRRLSKIRAKEVSLVDEAANGRDFLIVKRRGEMSGKANQDGKVLKTTGGDNGDSTATPAADKEVFKKLVAGVKEAFDKVTALPGDKDVTKMVHPDQFSMFTAMADALDWVANTLVLVKSDLVSFVQSGGTTGFMGEDVVSQDVVAKKLEEFGDEFFTKAVAMVAITKAGKKMKKDRLMKLKDAVKALSDLVSEVDGDPTVNKEENVSKAATETPATSSDKGGAPAAPAASESSAIEAAVTKAVEAATAKLGETVTKSVKELGDRLTKLEAPAKPAGQSADSTEEPTTKATGGKDKSIWAGVL